MKTTKTTKKAAPSANLNQNAENWNFEASIRKKSMKRVGLQRKIKTRGASLFHLDDNKSKEIITDLRKGFEVRLAINGSEAIRLFPVLASDYKSVYVCAQSMGDFRTKVYSENGVTLKSHGKVITEKKADEMRIAAKERNEAWRKNLIEVTPDTVLTCPNCGTLLRIGRSNRPPTLEAA